MNNVNCYYWRTRSDYDTDPEETDILHILYIDDSYTLDILKEDLKKEIKKNPDYLLKDETLFWNFLSNLEERKPCIYLRIPKHKDLTTIELKQGLFVDTYDLTKCINVKKYFKKREYASLIKEGKKIKEIKDKKAKRNLKKLLKEWDISVHDALKK